MTVTLHIGVFRPSSHETVKFLRFDPFLAFSCLLLIFPTTCPLFVLLDLLYISSPKLLLQLVSLEQPWKLIFGRWFIGSGFLGIHLNCISSRSAAKAVHLNPSLMVTIGKSWTNCKICPSVPLQTCCQSLTAPLTPMGDQRQNAMKRIPDNIIEYFKSKSWNKFCHLHVTWFKAHMSHDYLQCCFIVSLDISKFCTTINTLESKGI